MTVAWVPRPDLPPRAPPDPDFPYGLAINIAGSFMSACELPLPYPAPGNGEWVLVCDACGFTTTIPAGGQADDPTKVRVPCQR